ncbi:unnamed protein product [Urochloa humidicola]
MHGSSKKNKTKAEPEMEHDVANAGEGEVARHNTPPHAIRTSNIDINSIRNRELVVASWMAGGKARLRGAL